jgi:transcriptional regulator with XRE-family HTH domain
MTPAPDIPIGERIRFYREAQHKKQAVVAGLAGITGDYLSQIERGLKTPTIALLHRIARILAVPTSALLGEPFSQPEEPGSPAIPAIHRALLATGRLHPTGTPLVLRPAPPGRRGLVILADLTDSL